MKQGAMQPRMRALSWRLGALALFLTLTSSVLAQCPNVYDQDGNVVTTPYWISCSGTSFTLSLQPSSPWGAFDINWGDGSAHTTGNSWTSPTIIQHTYNAVVDTFQLTITQLSNGCTVHGVVVIEQATNASIQVPIGAYTSVCAPATVDFVNSSTNVSETTVFTWDFGDGTPPLTFDYTNWLQTVSHLYADAALINCQTTVSLTASNYCNVMNGSPSVATFTPVNIWTIDQANITVSNTTLCNPSNTFTFTNTTIRNCYNQGNTFQRQEMWNFGDYWGLGHDSIVGWNPFPPSLPQTITFPGVGDYTVTLYDSSYCGLDSATITVHVINPPVASISLQPAVACVGQQVTFFNQSSGNGQSYLWNFGNNNTWSNQGNGNVTYTYNTPGTYTVSAVAFFPGLGSSCRDTATVQVTVLPSPTAVVIATPTQSCDSALVVLSSQTTNATAYSWNLGGGFGTFNGQYPDTLLYNTPGTYTITLTVTSANGCTSSDSQTIRIYASPDPGFTANTPCVGQPVNFTNTSTSGASGSGNQIVSRTWNFGDSSTSTQNNPSHTYNTAGTYNVSLSVNTQHCSASITQPIVVNPAPVASFTMSQTSGCQPVHVVFTNTSVGATTFNWNFGDGQSSTLENPVHDFYFNSSSNHTFTITLTVTNQYGCTDTETHQVTVLGGPVAAIGVGSTSIGCTSTPIQFTNNSSGASSVLWNFGDGTTSTQNNPSHTYVNNTGFIQNFTVTLTAFSAGGCSGITTVQVPVYPVLDLQVSTPPQSGCSPYTFQSPVFAGVQGYAWDFGDGSTSTLPFPSHTYVNTTNAIINYTVHFVGTSAFGCTDSLAYNVAVSPQAIASIVADPTGGCSPLTVQINSNSTNASSLAWNFGDGTTSTSATNTHVFNNNTGTIQTYVVTLIANSVGNCPNTTAIEIPVYPSIDVTLPVTNVGGCSPYVFQAPTATGAQQYNWNFGDGTSSTLPFPVHVYNNPGSTALDYTVHFIGSNSFGCSDSADIQVHVLPQAIAQINAAPVGGCSPVTVNFQNASSNASSILWNFGDGQTSSASTVAHTFVNTTNSVITYQVQLIANAIGGCNDTTYIQIPVYPALDVQMPITSAQGCSPFIFQSPTFTGVQTFNWNFGDGTSSNLPFPTHIYTNNSSSIQNYTIHFIGMNGYGCADSADIAVTVYPQAVAQIQMNPNSGCSPLVVDLTNTSINATSIQWSFSNGGTSTANSLSHTFVNPTNATQIFTVELVANGLGGCSDTTQLQVPVYPALDMIVPVTSVQGCSPLTFVAPQISGVQSFSWNFGDGFTSNLPYPIHVFTNTSNAVENFTIHLVGTSSYGCTDSVNIPVSVLPQAVASVVADPTIGCSPLAVNFVSNSQNATSLNWNFGDGSTSTASVVSHVFGNTTSLIQLNTVTLIANNSYGCADTTGIQIPVYPELNLTVNNDPQNGCSPYTFLVPSMAGVQTYFWDFGDGFTSNLPYPVHSFSNNSNQVQTHVVHFVGTSGFGCSDSLDFVVTVQPEVTADIQANVTNGCGPLEVTFTNNSVNASGYTWSYGNGSSSNTNLITHNVVYSNGTTVPQVFQVSLLANQVNGCTDVDTLTITVYPNSAAGFNFAGVGCSPLNVNFNNTSSFGTTAQWNFGDGTNSNEGYPSHTFYANGFSDTNYNVTLIATNSYGCADTIQHPVTVLYSPIAAGGITSLSGCYPLNVVFSNNSQGASSYVWNYGNGITSTTDAASHEYAYFNLSNQTQTYQITLTATAPNGCSSVVDTSVSVLPQITADADVYVSGCNPVSAVFNNQSEGATSYLWTFGNGNTSTNANENQLFYNNGNTDTTYVVTLTTTNNFNCSVSHEYLILVHPLPQALFTATPELQTWPANEVTIVNSSFGTNLGYHWSFGDGTQAFISSPGTHAFPTWGTFDIELIVNQGLCTDTLVKPITIVPPAAEANFNVQAEGCAPVVVTLQNASNFAASYLWIFGDGGTSSASNPTYTYWTPGTYSITLIAYGYDGGSDTLILSNVIVVYPNATAAFTVTPNEVSIPSQPVYLLNASTVATTYQWSFGDGETSTAANPIHYYQAEGNYNIQLIANNQYNCPDTLTYYNVVHAVGDGLLDYPNAFTPNHLGQGDGVYDPIGYSNDIFCPLHKGVTSYQLQIFNKWGELLFETDNVHVGWDGYYRGQLCKEDVYVWKARATFANGTSVTKAGDVTLLAR